MSTLVPLISSGVAGPLGVLHLPRLWQKVSLEARGKLASGYPAVGNGYDQMVISALGLDKATLVNFVETEKPTYPEFEAWVLKQNGGQLDQAAVAKLNGAIEGYHHDDDTRGGILAASGIPDDAKAPRDAINLNNLEDWKEFHDTELK